MRGITVTGGNPITRGITITGGVTVTVAIAGPTVTAAATTVVVSPPAAPDERHRHVRASLRYADDLDPVGRVRGLGFLDRQPDDLDALEADLDLRPQDVADRRAVGDGGGGEAALRLLRAGGAPGERAVRAVARELDIDTTRHAAVTLSLRRRPLYQTRPAAVPDGTRAGTECRSGERVAAGYDDLACNAAATAAGVVRRTPVRSRRIPMADELSETGPGAPSDPPTASRRRHRWHRCAAAAGTPSPPTTPVAPPAEATPTTPVARRWHRPPPGRSARRER